MANIKEALIAMLIPAIKGIGKLQLSEVLSKIQEHNTPEVYENTLKSIHSSFSLLKQVAEKSKTKIDDGLIDMVLETVEEAADDDNVQL